MEASFALDELSWPQVQRIIARDPRLLLPVGALEQHGPHLPLGTNTLISKHVCAALSRRLGILRAPTFAYGVTASQASYAGTAGLRRKTFHRSVNELLARWEDHGISEFIIVSAHRYEPHLEAVLMALTASSATTVYDLFQIDVHDLLEGDPEREHAGELETSLLLHLAPHLVGDASASDFVVEGRRLRTYIRRRMPAPPLESRGVLGRPSLASAAKGAALFARLVDVLGASLDRSGTHRDVNSESA
ncbi:MAG: creatininase family protein [Gemmatimonadota bacterium]|nr:creatininase family protein [Gemmatimonadota bacterium]MDH5758591.1 creatininase family protein [Gemmatimonadota bacterium]